MYTVFLVQSVARTDLYFSQNFHKLCLYQTSCVPVVPLLKQIVEDQTRNLIPMKLRAKTILGSAGSSASSSSGESHINEKVKKLHAASLV